MKEIYSKICRLCLQITDDLLAIYESSDNMSYLIMEITNIKSFQISKDDGFPENVCKSCVNKLKSSFEFKNLCEASDAFLRNYDLSNEDNDLTPIKIEQSNEISPDDDLIEADENNVCIKDEEIIMDKNVAEQFEIIYAYSDSKDISDCENSLPKSDQIDVEVINNSDIPDIIPIDKTANKSEPRNISLDSKKSKKRSYKQVKSTECSVCHKVFSHAGNMRRHALIHQGIKPHACHLCGKKFSRSSTLKDHVDIFHARNVKEYSCKLCDYKNLRRSELAMHMVVKHQTGTLSSVKPRFSKPKPQQCSICHKTLSSTAALNMHMKIHNNVREHLCRHCGRAFHHKAGLENHERIHTGEKPYMCPHCPKRFSQQIGLRIHERTHTGEKPYQCKICLKSFSQQTHLRTHSFTHSGERRYACDMCDKRFALREGLRYHQMAHTGETPFKCAMCNKGFYIQYKLKVHMAKSHHIKMEIAKK